MPEKIKANPDYTASAKDLSCPKETLDAYNMYLQRINAWKAKKAEYDALNPELLAQVTALAKEAGEMEDLLRKTIKEKGGFQDITNGHYALISIAKNAEYHVQPFEEIYSQYAPSVITKAINVSVLEGHIKGELLNRTELERQGIITYKNVERTIIK